MAVIASILSLLGIFADAKAEVSAVSVETFGKGNQRVLHSKYKLSRSQRDAYKLFRKKTGYFGAIGVHKEGEVYFWIGDMHDLETARLFGKRGCERTAEREGKDPSLCVLYASVMPKGMNPRTGKAAGLSEEAFDVFFDKYLKTQKPGRFGAFAISRISHWGYTSNRVNAAEAEGAAIASCEAVAARMISGWSNEVRRNISQLKLNKCRVIHTHWP